MSTALAVTQEEDLIYTLSKSLYVGGSVDSIRLVLSYCKSAGLDPMLKPVHIVPMWSSKQGGMVDTIMPGIGMYRIQASRTGQFAGMTEPEFGPMITTTISGVEFSYPEWAKCTVKRALSNGVIAEFSVVEYWTENYAVKGGKEKSLAPNAMWLKRPHGQIAKCVQAQALRIAFPELGAAPTADEMEGKTISQEEIDITPAAAEVKVLPPYSDADFAKNLPIWMKSIEDGKKTSEQIINMVSTKYVLSDDQIEAVTSIVSMTIEEAA